MSLGAAIPDPRDILYINVSRIGDTLLATPAMKAIASYWPSARLHLLAHPKREEVLRHLPFAYRVGAIEKNRARFMGWLPGKRYDLAVVSNYDEALIDYALRVSKRVVAFRQTSTRLNDKLFSVVDRPPNQSMHAVDLELHLPAALGVPPAGRGLCYHVLSEENAWAQRFLTEEGAGGHRPLIGLQIASFPTKAYRDWPVENFRQLCIRVQDKWPDAHFLILGGPLEKDRTTALNSMLGKAATLCAGRLSLRQTAALMNQLDLYIGVDTGPTHIMGALHRPMVALYHGFSPSWLLQPLENPVCHVVDHPRAGACTPDDSMAEITVDRVWETVDAVLSKQDMT